MKSKIILSITFTLSIIFFSFQNGKYSFKNDIINYISFKKDDPQKLYCPADMEVTLWAESPLLFNPTNMDVDAKGRVWVTEAVNYRDFTNKPEARLNHPNGERIVILEDSDQDGKADKSTVFVEDKEMISPLGITVLGNKVYVAAAPNLIVYTDENGDDKADKKEILLTGFGGKDHDHSLHSGVAGPDGNYYFNVGNAGPHIVTDKSGWTLRSGSMYTGGSPYNLTNAGNMKSSDGKVYVGGMAFRMTKDGKNLKVLAHNFRNSYEVAVDSYGNMWQNDNDDQVIACRTSFVMEGGNAGYFSADGTRSWQADRQPGQDMFTASWHLDDPGVMPSGDNTGSGSPTGVHVYEGDAFGSKYRGMLLSCEAGRNVIFNYFPKAKGAGFELNRNDLISSQGLQSNERYEWFETGQDTRKWFRPSDICSGTDGSIFIADWYDPIVGGHAMKDSIGIGKIYRVVPKGKKLSLPKIDLSTTAGQIEALKNPAQNVRNLGFEALKMAGEKSLEAVLALLKSENPYHQARAIWLLPTLGKNGVMEAEKLLRNENSTIRLVAFRALKAYYGDNMAIYHKMKSETDPAILREIAIAMRDVPFVNAKEIIENILKKYNGNDPWLLEALGTAAFQKEEEVYELTKKIYGENWNSQRSAMAWRLHPASAVNEIKERANSTNTTANERHQMLTALAFIKTKSAALAMIELTKSSLKDVSDMAYYWVNFRKNNDWADLLNWEELADKTMSANYLKQLELSKIMQDEKADMNTRLKIANELSNDADGGNIIIDLVSKWQINNPKIREVIATEIFNNPSLNVRTLASQFFERSGSPIKIDMVTRMKADAGQGKTIFTSYCTNCHRHGEDGKDIGPDLTNIHQKFDKLSLVDAIVNPSASMVFGYESYNITTKKGQSYIGFILGDSGTKTTLKDAAGQTITIKNDQIASKEKSKNSLMPNPIDMGLKEQELADLSAYLLSFK
jgi:putative membrane-bound dehydrogenase-like protein